MELTKEGGSFSKLLGGSQDTSSAWQMAQEGYSHRPLHRAAGTLNAAVNFEKEEGRDAARCALLDGRSSS